MKTINEIIQMIDLQEEVASMVLNTYNRMKIEKNEKYIKLLNNIESAPEARERLKEILEPDNNNMKILTCMLYALTFTYEKYQAIGIDDEVFSATNKCFTRFLEEHKKGYNEWVFDRDWWTYRQIAMTIFRIGQLEYEMKDYEGEKFISIHIPSDAILLSDKIKDSIKQAKQFFKKYYPLYSEVEYRCNSWLLSPSLKKILPPTSNILKFQSLFKIIKETYSSSGFISWVYKKHYEDYHDLPENTTLQRNMKKYLLEGSSISIALGVLK